MKIPQHRIESVLKAYKKHLLLSEKGGIKGNPAGRFLEKKRLVRNKIFMDIAKRTAVIRHDSRSLKLEEKNRPESGAENRIKYHTIGPDGKKTHSINVTDMQKSWPPDDSNELL